MSECEHMIRDDSGAWHVTSNPESATDCLFCEADRLRSQLETALRERDEARRSLNALLIAFEETDDVRVLVDGLRALAAIRGTEGK